MAQSNDQLTSNLHAYWVLNTIIVDGSGDTATIRWVFHTRRNSSSSNQQKTKHTQFIELFNVSLGFPFDDFHMHIKCGIV